MVLACLTLIMSCSDATNSTSEQHSAVSKQEKKSPKEAVDLVVDSIAFQNDFMGSIAVSRAGELIYSRAIGYADVATTKPSNQDTRYRIGSLSKTYTATLILKAVEDGALALEQTIEQFFPNLENAKHIRIVDLLQHHSGIPNFTQDKQFLTYHTEFKSKQEMLRIIQGYASNFTPNSKAEYSNSNYFLLALVLESVYSKSYEQILNEHIVQPLGLTATYVGKKVSISQNEAVSYRYTDNWQVTPETDMSLAFGAGSIVSTPNEVSVFMNALFNGQIVSKEYVKQMKTLKNQFGMGLKHYTLSGRDAYGHRGSIDGFKSSAVYFPDEQVTLVVTSNGSNDNMEGVFRGVVKAYFNDAPIAIAADELEKYVGVYTSQSDPSDKVVFTRQANVLIHIIGGEFQEQLIYKGQRQFLFEQMYAPAMLFIFSEDGSELELTQDAFTGTYIKDS